MTQISKLFSKEFQRINNYYQTEDVGLSYIKAELLKLGEKIIYFLSSMDNNDFTYILNVYLILYFKLLANICFYGSDNPIRYLHQANFN